MSLVKVGIRRYWSRETNISLVKKVFQSVLSCHWSCVFFAIGQGVVYVMVLVYVGLLCR